MEILVNLIDKVLPVFMFVTGFYFGHHLKKYDEMPNIPKQIKEEIKEAKEEKKNEKKKREIDEKARRIEEYVNNIDNYPYNQKKIE